MKDPSKKSMGRLYIGAGVLVLGALTAAVLIGRFSKAPDPDYVSMSAPPDKIADAPAPAETEVKPEPQAPIVPVIPERDDPEIREEPEVPAESLGDPVEPEADPDPVPAGQERNGVVIYRITQDDTLTRISNLTGFGIMELAEFNQIKDPNLIYTEHFLAMPGFGERDVIVDDAGDIKAAMDGGEIASELSGDQAWADVAEYINVEAIRGTLAEREARDGLEEREIVEIAGETDGMGIGTAAILPGYSEDEMESGTIETVDGPIGIMQEFIVNTVPIYDSPGA